MAEEPTSTNDHPSSSYESPSEASNTSTQTEKMLSQAEVNELVGRAKRAAYEKGKSEREPATPTASTHSRGLSEQEIDEIVQRRLTEAEQKAQAKWQQQQEETKRAQLEKESQKVMESLSAKVSEAAKKYDDYDEVVGNTAWNEVPQVLLFANEHENAGDILYELGKNSSKVGVLLALAEKSPSLARQEMRRLSQSIKANNDAVVPSAKDPLKQPKPSNIGFDSGNVHKMSVSDMRRMNATRR